MPTQFVEQQFPPDISYGSKGGPGFSTTVFMADSGFEQRNINWQNARARYDVSHGIRDKVDMDTVLTFFYNMKGKAVGFRYKDWSDYQLTAEVIGVGDTVETVFQIIKTYTVGAENYVRNIVKLVPTVISIEINAVPFVEGVDFTVDDDTGIITFSTVPGAFDIEVTCEFDVPVRFDTDQMAITLEAFELETWDDIPLVELRL